MTRKFVWEQINFWRRKMPLTYRRNEPVFRNQIFDQIRYLSLNFLWFFPEFRHLDFQKAVFKVKEGFHPTSKVKLKICRNISELFFLGNYKVYVLTFLACQRSLLRRKVISIKTSKSDSESALIFNSATKFFIRNLCGLSYSFFLASRYFLAEN